MSNTGLNIIIGVCGLMLGILAFADEISRLNKWLNWIKSIIFKIIVVVLAVFFGTWATLTKENNSAEQSARSSYKIIDSIGTYVATTKKILRNQIDTLYLLNGSIFKLENQLNNDITGGDSYGEVYPTSILDKNKNPVTLLYFQNKGKYPLSNVNISYWNLEDLYKNKRVGNNKDTRATIQDLQNRTNINVGNVSIGGGQFIGQPFLVNENQLTRLNFSITAKNGFFAEQLRMIKINGKIENAIKINTITNGKTHPKILVDTSSSGFPKNKNGEINW